jgi:hypothetical protein
LDVIVSVDVLFAGAVSVVLQSPPSKLQASMLQAVLQLEFPISDHRQSSAQKMAGSIAT